MDPLVKMAVLHFQFESIHPFYDGNGRTGRILHILYLVLKGLLNIPVLYLSRSTAAGYLNKLAEGGVLVKQKHVNSNYYVNQPLFDLLARLE